MGKRQRYTVGDCFLFAELEQDGFSKNPFFHGIIAEVPEQHKSKEGEVKPSLMLLFLSHLCVTLLH